MENEEAKLEEPIAPLETSSQGFAINKTLIIVLLTALLLFTGAVIFLYVQSKATPIAPAEPATEPIATKPAEVEWKTYTNTEAGFTLRYPDTVRFQTEDEDGAKPGLWISVEKVSDIPEDLPQLMGRDYAISERERLMKAGSGDVKIGTLNASETMTLGMFEICSVMFRRTLTFFPGEYRVMITLDGQNEATMDSMPEFFTVDPANCGSRRMWDMDNKQDFETVLSQKKGAGAGQQWYDTFDEIVKTITLTRPAATYLLEATPNPKEPVSPLPEGWTTYKNSQYGFEISYPSDYDALSDKDNLSAYPNGIVLLYAGGQAYDVIIEVWDKKEDYEDNYGPRASELKVVESDGKFITILDNTKNAETEEIVESFKLQ